jgi:hypothetical protein
LEEISRKGGRGHENGTLGNVQGNNLRGFREKGLGRARGEGILGQSLIYQSLFPFTLTPISFPKAEAEQVIRYEP